MPTRLQFILAHSLKIGTVGGGAIVGAATLWVGLGYIEAAKSATILVTVAVLAAIPLGCLVGTLIIWPVLLALASKLNGAPFSADEDVYILKGPNRGQISRIYDVWASRHQARVELGPDHKRDFADVFFWNEICRHK